MLSANTSTPQNYAWCLAEMPKGKFLVVDASVVISAASRMDLLANVLLAEDNPISTMCQEVLATILNARYRVVLTLEIQSEWDAHLHLPHSQREQAENYLYRWRAGMRRRGLLYSDKVPQRAMLRRIVAAMDDEDIRTILQKDLLLIEAALATDQIIISRDDKARHHFSEMAYHVEELRDVMWINPCQPEEECVLWLKNGANRDEKRRLGFLKS